jgi:DNA-binding MarR family transcriptional regulator
MSQEKTDYESLGFILASSYRTNIVLTLGSHVATPKQMANVTNLRIGHVSNVLKSLVDRELIECVNAEAKRGRIYRLTPKGKRVFEMMKKLGLNKTS